MTKVTINKIMAPEESNEIGISEGESIFFFTFLLSTTKWKNPQQCWWKIRRDEGKEKN